MKRIIFIILFVFAPIISNAQKIGIGLRTGINISNIIYKASPPFSLDNVPATRFQAAVFGEFSFGKYFSIVPEVAFSQQGYNLLLYDTDISGNRLGNETNALQTIYNYINVPVLFRYTWKFNKVKLFLNTGPQIGILISGISRFKDRINNDDISNYSSTDFGWVLGGGIGYKLGPGWLFADTRYTFGFINLYNSPRASAQNSVIGISLGYIYEFGK